MQNVLVTGGAGFIGSNFVHTLLASDPGVHIINLDALTYAGSLENLNDLPDPARHTFIRGDICDRPLLDDLFRRYAIDTVVHFAAETHVDRSILGPGQFIQTNVVGTFTLLEAARQAWLDGRPLPTGQVRFHHVSTDEVFGSLAPQDPPFCETSPYAPNSPYAASKAASDHLVRAYFHTYGLPVTITNCSNNYGPRQFPEKLIPLVILNGVQGKLLPVYGDGQQVRDWLYVEEHCEAIRLVLQNGQPGQTYIVGGGNQPPNLEIIHSLCDILDEVSPASSGDPHRSQIRFVTDRPGHDRRYAMDIRKIEQELGWRPRQSLHDGLLKTVTWYLDHPQWVSAILQSSDFTAWVERNYAKRATRRE
jgi:dTDP-glucose 4,6-dehydratase